MENEKKIKPFVLRIDPERMEALERWAADEFRSVNGQLLYIIEQALRKSGRGSGKPGGSATAGRTSTATGKNSAGKSSIACGESNTAATHSPEKKSKEE